MAFDINTNVASLQAQNYLQTTNNFQTQTINEVTSGLRIVNSGDDAAGLAVANSYRSSEAVLTQGVRNANDGLSQLQIADGGISNISQLLDRARTLATESATGTFTGDRSILNSEFQSVLGEIDRQAQSVGLNQVGEFAKNLNVYICGGQSSGNVSATQNGSVNLNLTSATVDTKSLGLDGVQAVNATGRDLSAGSATSVQNIVQDTNNTHTGNTTTFDFTGPGFNNVAVSVNLSGVTDTTTLVAALNSAIQAAGAGSSAADTALANSGITASVFTDAQGGQHLAFNSGSAFQVSAGDVLANALLGNTVAATGPTAPNGVAIATTVTGGANATAGTIGAGGATVQIQGGGLSGPVDITLASGATIGDLQTAVNGNATLQAAGLTLTTATAGSPLTFTSATGQKFSVEAAGDTGNVLGLGTFQLGAANAVDYNTVTAGANYNNATAFGTANLEFSVNGSSTAGHVVSVNLSQGDATSGTNVGNVDLSAGVTINTNNENLNVAVDGGAVQHIALAAADTTDSALVSDINGQLTGATASLVVSGSSTFLQITSNSKGANSSVAVTNGSGTALADTFGTATATAGLSRTLGSVVSAINQAISADPTLQAGGLTASNPGNALVLSSSNGTYFQLNAYGVGAPNASANLGFGTTGTAFGAGNTSAPSAFTSLESGGAYQTQAFGFTPISHGNDTQSVTLSANDSTGTPQSLTVQLQDVGGDRNAQSIDQAIASINSALQQSNVGVLQGITAVKDQTSGTDQIKFISSNAFNVSIGSDANGTGIQSQGNNYNATIVGTGSTADISNISTATAAVTALGNAVTTLGTAQAIVGRGENELNYAINLASSQLTNESSAESQIRDANLAAEAANLTKVSIQLQAGIAALAQANSAPQAVLKLLQ